MKKTVLAIDAGGTYLKACLFDGGAPLTETAASFAVDSSGELEPIRQAYRAMLGEMRARADALELEIVGVAVDTPGPFDYRNGVSLMKHKYTAMYGVPLRPWYREVLGDVEVRFLHDSHAFILGALEQAPKSRNIAGIMLGTGLGFALMNDGRALITEAGSPQVSIYARPFRGGIAEDIISAGGIVNAYAKKTGTLLGGAKAVADRAEAGDADALAVHTELGEAIGELIHDIIAEQGSEVLFLGGQISRSFELFAYPLEKALSDIPSLRSIRPVRDIELVHLRGAVKYYNDN